MALITKDELVQILKFVDESTIDKLELQIGDLKLLAKKSGRKEVVPEMQIAPQKAAEAPLPAKESEESRGNILKAKTPAAPESPATRNKSASFCEEEGLTAIRSPMLGAFYRAPKPDAQPFVELGQMVSEDDAVCIIEVMKLFNTIKAGVRGRIARVCVENAQMVEFQEPLFLVEETTAKKKKSQPKK
jgi:acetyl-CoA carboxylase biotin carboxyl carrier protein